jgi:ketosteroid isomerase-like protein
VTEQANTQLAQDAYAAFGRGDMPALAEVMADDIEWVSPGDPGDDPLAGTYSGKDNVLGWFGKLAETLDFQTFEPRDFIAQGDKVVSTVYAEATVRSTGRSFVNDEAHVWTFRDGKLARFRIYFDTAAAAAAHRVE